MRIVFIGTVEFSLKSLEKLINLNATLAGVVAKRESAFNSDWADLTPLCKEKGIPILYSRDVNSPEEIEWIKEKRPDVVFCFGWSSLLKEELLSIAPLGVVGFHPAALPNNRGRHPIIWALALGLEKTASTFFFMDQGADSGDILDQKIVTIEYEDDARALYNRITDVALDQIASFTPALERGDYSRTPQDPAGANYWRKRSKKDGLVDLRMGSRAVYNLVRALTRPYPGAHVEYKGQEIKIWRAAEEAASDMNDEPGKVLDVAGESVLVKCYDGAVRLLEHEFVALPEKGDYIK